MSTCGGGLGGWRSIYWLEGRAERLYLEGNEELEEGGLRSGKMLARKTLWAAEGVSLEAWRLGEAGVLV